MNLHPVQRMRGTEDYKTDENNDIVDVDIWKTDIKLIDLEHQLKNIPGIVETGLFLTSTDLVIIGKGEEAILEKK